MQHQESECIHCSEIGHYQKCCRKAGNFPKKNCISTGSEKKVHITGNVEEAFLDEDGNLATRKSAHMLSRINLQKELLLQFGISLELSSVDKKVG